MVHPVSPVKEKVTVVNLLAPLMVLVRDMKVARTRTVERVIAMDQAKDIVLMEDIMGSLTKVMVHMEDIMESLAKVMVLMEDIMESLARAIV